MAFNKLFNQWKQLHSFNAFISDGIVDCTQYAKPHILFVLRDMNCQTEHNLCDDLANDGSGWKTWNNVGRWTKALLDGDEVYPRDMSREKRVEQLRRIAVMNLKKEGGVSRADGNELLNAVKSQQDLIYEEICLCDPNIIICCGLPMKGCLSNADLLWHHVFPICSEWKKVRSVHLPQDWYFYYATINGKQVPVVSFCHPQVTNLCGCRGHEMLFAPLYRDMLHIREMFLKNASGVERKKDGL